VCENVGLFKTVVSFGLHNDFRTTKLGISSKRSSLIPNTGFETGKLLIDLDGKRAIRISGVSIIIAVRDRPRIVGQPHVGQKRAWGKSGGIPFYRKLFAILAHNHLSLLKKSVFPEEPGKLGDGKCLEELRKSFVELPSAIQFLRLSRD
jgi:hypothetical protein